MKCVRICIFSLCLIGSTCTATAETRYVTDELQLSLHEWIDSKGRLLKRLNSGEELELLEQDGFFAKVRTQDGTVGWTKAGFLIEERPARTQLTELQQQYEVMTSRLEQSEADAKTATNELNRLKQQQQQAETELQTQLANHEGVIAALDRLQDENEVLRNKQIQLYSALPLNWVLIAAGISFVLGIMAGIGLFDYRSRRRHGGFRIY